MSEAEYVSQMKQEIKRCVLILEAKEITSWIWKKYIYVYIYVYICVCVCVYPKLQFIDHGV